MSSSRHVILFTVLSVLKENEKQPGASERMFTSFISAIFLSPANAISEVN